MLLAIDPGTVQSGFIEFDQDGNPDTARVIENSVLLQSLRGRDSEAVIEMVSSFGMPVGKETFETVVWIGRFMEAINQRGRAHRLFRRDIKIHFCNSARAKDPNVWQAILDRFGGKEAAVGNKKRPGPLYGITSHSRAALAVGLAWIDGVRSDGLL